MMAKVIADRGSVIRLDTCDLVDAFGVGHTGTGATTIDGFEADTGPFDGDAVKSHFAGGWGKWRAIATIASGGKNGDQEQAGRQYEIAHGAGSLKCRSSGKR